MPKVELIYDSDCPNAENAREQLRSALAAAGLPPRWQEWNRADPGSPAHVRDYGSPTILVDGKDVAGAGPGGGPDSCRVYVDSDGRFHGVPAVEMIVAALRS